MRRRIEIWAAAQEEQSIAVVAKAFSVDKYTAGDIIREVEHTVHQLWKDYRLLFWFYEEFKLSVEEGDFPRYAGEFTKAELGQTEPSVEHRDETIIVRRFILAAEILRRKLNLYRGVRDSRIAKLSEVSNWFFATRIRTLKRRKEMRSLAIKTAMAKRAAARAEKTAAGRK